MNILILTDLEGVIGYTISSDIEQILNHWVKNLSIVTNFLYKHQKDVSITICDTHNNGFYCSEIEKRMNDERISIIGGIKPMLEILSSFDAGLLIGFHGKAGAEGKYSHSFRYDFVNIFCETMNRSVGEIYLFSRLLESYKIPVFFVSGEGFFEDELKPHCVYYRTGIARNIEEDYLLFTQKINLSINFFFSSVAFNEDPKNNFEEGTITVELDNLDKVQYASQNGFEIENNQIAFKDVASFFSNIVQLSYLMNEANKEIYRNNIAFARSLVPYKELLLDDSILEILRKPLNTINKNDRERVDVYLREVKRNEKSNNSIY